MTDAQKQSLAVEISHFAAPHTLVGDAEFDESPHYKFDESLTTLRCIRQASNRRRVIAYQVWDKGGGRRKDKEALANEPLIVWEGETLL